MKYEVVIKKNKEKDEFEIIGDNTAIMWVNDKQGEKITKPCNVKLYLSRNAMLGLGKELIRAAQRDFKGDVWHFYPVQSRESIYESLGIILMPESVEPVVIDHEPGKIDNFFNDK